MRPLIWALNEAHSHILSTLSEISPKQNAFKGVSMIRVDLGPISETVYIDIILKTIIER
jgi:hypothetical protein